MDTTTPPDFQVTVTNPSGLSRAATIPQDPPPRAPIELPDIDEDDDRRLEPLLRDVAVEYPDMGTTYWPPKLLRHVMSRKVVLGELEHLFPPERDNRAATCIDYIVPQDEELYPPPGRSYLTIFAMLSLLCGGAEIINCIRDEVSDEELPVEHASVCRRSIVRCLGASAAHGGEGKLVNFASKWAVFQQESFVGSQWRFLIPFFSLGPQDAIQHKDLESSTILPLRSQSNAELSSSIGIPEVQVGGFGSVTCVMLDPWSHSFQEILHSVRLPPISELDHV
jgi:hypothetical protein